MSPILPKSIQLPPSGSITITNEEGKLLKINTNQSSYLTQLLFWEGYQQFEYTNIFTKLIKKLTVFYDVGSNIGYYSLLASMENPNIQVVAFEPASGPLHFLKKNVSTNKFSNIKIEDIALSEQTGTLTFYEIQNKKYQYLEHNLAGESNAGSKTTGRNFVPTEVKTISFDDYVTQNQQSPIDLVKLDTEGTEHLIMQHAHIVLEQMKAIVICETLFNTIEADLEGIFTTYGYEFFNHTKSGLQQVSTITRSTDNGVRNCFFVHPSKFHLIEEFVL